MAETHMADGPETPQPYGFWVRIRDRESAAYAARMSGLPVFIAGIAQVFAGLFDATLDSGEKIVTLVVAVSFTCAGIAIRRGVLVLVPIVSVVMLLVVVFGLAVLAIEIFNRFQWDIPDQSLTASFTWRSIIPVLILLMMISGLRGWWRLRKERNDTERKREA